VALEAEKAARRQAEDRASKQASKRREGRTARAA
jgi:hypothetical protein